MKRFDALPDQARFEDDAGDTFRKTAHDTAVATATGPHAVKGTLHTFKPCEEVFPELVNAMTHAFQQGARA